MRDALGVEMRHELLGGPIDDACAETMLVTHDLRRRHSQAPHETGPGERL